MSVRLSGPPAGVCGSKVDISLLRARARAILRAVGQSRSELSLSLVDDAEGMRAVIVNGEIIREEAIPENLQAQADEYREIMLDAVSMVSD